VPRLRFVSVFVLAGLLLVPVGFVGAFAAPNHAGPVALPNRVVPSAPAATIHPASSVPFFPNIDIIDHSTPYAWQVEPTMVVNNTGTVFVGWKETDSATDAGFRVGSSYSTDQGQTWAPNILMNQTHVNQNCRDSDPWMAMDPHNRVHFAYLEYDPGGGSSPPCGSGLDVSNTTNGHDWGTVHYIPGMGGLVDKDSIAFDSSGRLYATWDEGNVLAFTWSDDNGHTWAPIINPGSQSAVLGTIVATAPNGTVYLTWWNFAVSNILFESSSDRGKTWTPIIRVNDRDGSASGGFPQYPLPAMVVDPKSGTLYTTWADSRNGNPDIYVANSTNAGKTWGTNHKINDNSGSSTQYMPAITVDSKGKVHAAWEDARTGNWNIFYANSTDGGQTWTANIKVTTAETAGSYTRPGDYFTIVPGPNDYIYVVWTDGRGKDFDIYYARNPGFPAHTVTVATSPTGLPVTVDNVTGKSPVTYTWIAGSSHTIGVTSPIGAGTSAQWVWTSWSDGGGITHSVVASADGTLTASFKKQYAAKVATNPAGLQFTIDGATFTAATSFWWDNGSSHGVAVASPQFTTPSVRYTFANWSDGGARDRTVVVTAPIDITAYFLQQQALLLATNPAGVAFTFDGSPYVGPQTFWLVNNTAHVVNADATVAGPTGVRYLFTGWSDGGARNHVVLFQGAAVLTASFSTQYYLTVTSAVPGASGSGWYDSGTRASAGVAYDTYASGAGVRLSFSSWSGDASGTGLTSNSILMNGPKTATAVYTTQYYLQVQSAYATASGSGWYDAGTTATASVDRANVTLSMGRRQAFVSWSGDASGSGAAASNLITMDGPKTAKAVWQLQDYVLVTSDGGDISGSGWYRDGSTVTLQAPATATVGGQTQSFAGWKGDVTSTSTSLTLTVDRPYTIHASYAATSLFGSSTTTTFGIAAIVLAIVIIAMLVVWVRRRKVPPSQ
jgi:hypothetical protein